MEMVPTSLVRALATTHAALSARLLFYKKNVKKFIFFATAVVMFRGVIYVANV